MTIKIPMKTARIIDQVKASRLAIQLRKEAGMTTGQVADNSNKAFTRTMVCFLENNAYKGKPARNWTAKHFESYVGAVEKFNKETK